MSQANNPPFRDPPLGSICGPEQEKQEQASEHNTQTNSWVKPRLPIESPDCGLPNRVRSASKASRRMGDRGLRSRALFVTPPLGSICGG